MGANLYQKKSRSVAAPKVVSEFVLSATGPEHFPREEFPEVAFLGRSNVGKSSLINALLGQKALAFTSSKPGCTQAQSARPRRFREKSELRLDSRVGGVTRFRRPSMTESSRDDGPGEADHKGERLRAALIGVDAKPDERDGACDDDDVMPSQAV
jgi:hypothetical protein